MLLGYYLHLTFLLFDFTDVTTFSTILCKCNLNSANLAYYYFFLIKLNECFQHSVFQLENVRKDITRSHAQRYHPLTHTHPCNSFTDRRKLSTVVLCIYRWLRGIFHLDFCIFLYSSSYGQVGSQHITYWISLPLYYFCQSCKMPCLFSFI